MAKRLYAKFLIGTAVVAVIGGAGVWGAARWSGPAADLPPPYAYEVLEDAPAEAAIELASLVPGAAASSMTVHASEPDRAVARAQVVTLPQSEEVIVGWTSQAAEPVLRSDISSEEEVELITALRKHLPENSTIIAMPALSARLAHFVPAKFPLAGSVEQQELRLPGPWAGQGDAIALIEARWQGDAAKDADAFPVLIDALLAEDVYGAARLQTLAGPDESYVILHVRDVFDLGVNVPDRIHVGQRDFPAAGQTHDKSRAVKDWVKTEGHAAYAVERREGGAIRAYYLADAKDKSTLLGQLLPFNTAMIGQVAGTSLVYQTGGYWVYRLQPVTGQM